LRMGLGVVWLGSSVMAVMALCSCISVVLLCAFDIGDRQLRHWLAN
jgi:hypothetical protein